jgi:DNA-binding response OmpR family regulator
VLLIGSDSIVSQAIELYLRKEGYDIRALSADPATWPANTGLDGHDQLVVIASPVSGERRAEVCRRLRQRAHVRPVPILALLDAGETNDLGSADGLLAGAAITARDDASAGEGADISLGWPYRLREVLATVEDLLTQRASLVSS